MGLIIPYVRPDLKNDLQTPPQVNAYTASEILGTLKGFSKSNWAVCSHPWANLVDGSLGQATTPRTLAKNAMEDQSPDNTFKQTESQCLITIVHITRTTQLISSIVHLGSYVMERGHRIRNIE